MAGTGMVEIRGEMQSAFFDLLSDKILKKREAKMLLDLCFASSDRLLGQ